MKSKLFVRSLLLASLSIVTLPSFAKDSAVLYRYIDSNGVKVINHTLPPKYAQRGYEIISKRGKVIEKVSPAMSKEEVEKNKAIAQIEENYRILKRRYSSVNDILAAKTRKLADIQTNIAILQGNINGINTEISNTVKRAAQIERAGGRVPESLMSKIVGFESERSATQVLLEKRMQEKAELADKFEQDIAAFNKGKEMIRARRQLSLEP